jgi:hypothetical protein
MTSLRFPVQRSTGDAFLGCWLVTEYVFDDDGALLGCNYQQRLLERLGDGRVRVTQRCRPDARLMAHPMAAFAGEWAFDLEIKGRARLYHGPDVLGSAMSWGEGVMTGRGVWPRFGYNFTSWSAMLAPDRQLTGGRFYSAGRCVAHLIGVGRLIGADHRVDESPEFPNLDLAGWPADLAGVWRGSRARFDASGACLGEEPMTRNYAPDGWREGEWGVVCQAAGARQRVSGPGFQGIARRVGPALELEGALAGGASVSMLEVVDAEARMLIGIHRIVEREQLQRVAIIRLAPSAT